MSAGLGRAPSPGDYVQVSSEELYAMSDEELMQFCMEELGMSVDEQDVVMEDGEAVGYNRSRLLARILRLAVEVEE